MHLTTLQLENFRGYASLHLDLHPRCTLLIGENGAGKTSILEGLAVALGTWFLGFPDVPDRQISQKDVRLTAENTEFSPRFPVVVRAAGTVAATPVDWTRTKLSKRGRTTFSGAKTLIALAKQHHSKIQDHVAIDSPILVYYGADQGWSHAAEAEPQTFRTIAYVDALRSSRDLSQLASWMKRREYAYLQSQQQMIEAAKAGELGAAIPAAVAAEMAAVVDKATFDPCLVGIERAVTACLDEAQGFYFSVSQNALCFRMKDEVLPISALSQGYRRFILLVADLAWRATRLNMHHGAEAARKSHGVVMIDEVELHLHPKWQRLILPTLMEIFPNVQFIATTHSPQVIASVAATSLRTLSAGEEPRPVGATFGRDSNALLEDLMGATARPSWHRDQLHKLAQLIDDSAYDEALALYGTLLVDLGVDDDELAQAKWQIEFERAMGDDA